MELDTGEALLRAWLELAAIIWNRQMVSGMTFKIGRASCRERV